MYVESYVRGRCGHDKLPKALVTQVGRPDIPISSLSLCSNDKDNIDLLANLMDKEVTPTKVRISGIEFDTLIRTLERANGTRLKSLNLRNCNWEQGQAGSFAAALKTSQLEVLKLGFTNNAFPLVPILGALLGNQFLQVLGLHGKPAFLTPGSKNQEEVFGQIRSGGDNQFDGNAMIATILNFESSLEKGENTTLTATCFSITGNSNEDDLPLLSDKAEFYLKLNSIGRKKLLGSLGDPKLWLDTIIEHKDDQKVTFALLSMNPSLFISFSKIGETSKPEHPPKR